jgi:hypothetical protein
VKKVYVFLLILALINLTFGFSSKVFASDYINVVLSPNVANTQNAITIQLRFDSIDIVPGTQIEIGFDEGSDQSTKMNIPTPVFPGYVTLQYGSTILTSSNTSLYPVSYYGGYAYRLQILTPAGTYIPRGTSFSIVIDKNTNIYPKTTGSHSLFVVVGSATLPANYTVGTSSTSQSITINSITVDTPKISETSTYTFVFTPGQSLVIGDKITVQFPAGFKMPTTIDGSNFALIQGIALISSFAGNVSVSGNSVTLTIPSTAYTFYSGYQTTLVFGAFTGIYNPSTAGSYTFYMYTSKQTTPASYTVTLGTKVSNLSVIINPLTENTIADYSLTFTTSSSGSLKSSSGIIYIIFPSGFTVPSQIVSGSVLVNGKTATATASGTGLMIVAPADIGNSSQVTVHITTDAKIKNPPANTTGYTMKVYTSSDQLQAQTQNIIFATSKIQNASVTIVPAIITKNASYVVDFTLGSGGALSSGDTIYVTFPVGTTLPAQISASSVSIKVVSTSKTFSPASVTVTLSTKTVNVVLPQVSIDANSEIVVTFDASANIVNPSTAGQLKLKVSTSKETTPVESDVFEIFANPVSSLVVTLQNPDGSSGYYITQPSFTISVKEILGATVTAFYKIGESDTYKTYDLVNKPSIKILEGKTAVYFYAQDNFGNKEPENSKTILVDLTDPIITITTPTENSVIVQPTYTLKGSIKAMDVSGAALTIDSKAVQINSDGSFEALVSVPKEGVYTTNIKVTSPSGRTKTLQFSVNYIARVTIFLQIGNDKAYINGEQIAIDAPPFISGGNVMVPLRFILTSFKANLDWDNIFQIITLTLGNNRMRLQIGNLRADVNGSLKMLPTSPVLVKGVTFVPLRFISENFGASVTWDPTLKAVSIVYPKP